ncbi:MAG: arsenical pump-driving ATPase [Rhizobiales bacterium]|nr:arsenical pump-driving ATPase [Hyphomicrobiales bacterium]
MGILDRPTTYLFFTGKGGVGKTSASCATAVALAARGAKVLLVSTDPASNVDEVLGQEIPGTPFEIPEVPGLFALNIDPESAAREYRERVVGPYRGVLPEAIVASIEEQLSGACTVEIAAFDEFARLIGTPDLTARFDHVVFDTAPTGHTLRLLSLPAAWTGFMDASKAGTSCLGPLQGLVAQKQLYERAVAALSDAARTTLVLVSRPARAPLEEAARASRELAAIGIRNQKLVVNAVFTASTRDDPIAIALESEGRAALDAMPAELADLDRTTVPLKPRQLIGLDALRGFFDRPSGRSTASQQAPGAELDVASLPHAASWSDLVDGIAADGHGIVLTMGKGGVGKTTMARRIAADLAARGHAVHLSTTDPAGSELAVSPEVADRISVGRIDPSAEVARYREEVMATTGKDLDADARALLEEDLASPCTEEIAVFQAFAATVARARDGFVVLDTAPTGHTILLLDAAQSFSREYARQSKRSEEAVAELLPRLRDPAYTRVILCTLAEATPVHEAAALQADLRRAGIEPFAWAVNQCLSGLPLRDPLLVARRNQEEIYLREIDRKHATRFSMFPLALTGVEGTKMGVSRAADDRVSAA